MFYPEYEYKLSNKSEDELRKLTLEEGLNEQERVYQILTKGQQLQKKAIYSNLHNTLQEITTFDYLFQVIIEELQQQDEENQIIAAKSLRKLIANQKIQKHQLYWIYELCTKILKIWSLPVLNEWIITTDQLLRRINIENKQVQQLILLLTDNSQPTVSRQSVAKLIGTLAEIGELPNCLLDRARNLCSDHDKEVRLVMAEDVMIKVCLSLNSDLIETYMLEKIMELYYDTDIIVKRSGMKLFFTVASQFSEDEIKNRCVKQFIDQIQSQNEESKLVMSKICGKTYQLIKDYLSEKSNNLFLQIYKDYAKHKNQEIRINFIHNFPAIYQLSQKKFDFFQESYLICCNDPQIDVRRFVLSCFHEIVILSDKNDILINVLDQFLQSDNDQILNILAQRFAIIINLFITKPQLESTCLKLFDNILNTCKWDLQIEFLKQLLDCQNYFIEIDPLFNCLMQFIKKGIPEIKKLCAKNIAKYLTNYKNLKKRQEYIQQFRQIYKLSNSYFNRIVYIEIVESFSELISRKLFKQYDFFDVLSYSLDNIVNVRIRLIKALPQIRQKIDLQDLQTQQLFDESVQNCIKGGTRSFQQVIQQTREELLKYYDQEKLYQQDQELQALEDILYQNDEKQRQLFGDYDDNNKVDLTDYLSKYRKRMPQNKTKIQCTPQLLKKEKLTMSAGGLLFKKSIDNININNTIDANNKSPILEIRKPKIKSQLPKSMCDVKKQFKLPSIKK